MFNEKELKAMEELEMHQGMRGEWLTKDGRKFLNRALAQRVLSEIHQLTHWSAQGMCDHFLKQNLCI